jgi:CheY-like chemotaxis protein
LSREIVVDTQGVLMDALRLYDEKRRDGELEDEDDEDEPANEVLAGLTADDLGLGELELLEQMPPVSMVSGEPDSLQLQRQRLQELAPSLAGDALERLALYLQGAAASPGALPSHGGIPALIACTPDEFLGHCLGTACCSAGMFSCTVADSKQLAVVRERCAVLNNAPLIVFDAPEAAEGFAAQRLEALAQLREPFPIIFQLVSADEEGQMVAAYAEGFQAVIPKPLLPLADMDGVERLIRFLGCMKTLVGRRASTSSSRIPSSLRASLARFLERPQPQSVAAILLQQVAEMSSRALTLVVRDGALVAEKGIGITGTGGAAVQAPDCRIPLKDETPLSRVINEGRIVSGTMDDPLLNHYLFPAIGAPRVQVGILLPLRHRGRTLAVIYGDFGDGAAVAVNTEMLDLLGTMASLVLEGAAGLSPR